MVVGDPFSLRGEQRSTATPKASGRDTGTGAVRRSRYNRGMSESTDESDLEDVTSYRDLVDQLESAQIEGPRAILRNAELGRDR